MFTRTYGDQPGVGLGVKSGTVGDIVEPVTNSPIVRAEGQHVIRHRDKCTLNRGNCPGEYIHIKSVKTHEPPDGNDEDDKRGGWQKFKDQLIEKSKTEQDDGRTATLRLGLPWLFWPERIFSLLPVRFASPERVRERNIFRLRISDVALG